MCKTLSSYSVEHTFDTCGILIIEMAGIPLVSQEDPNNTLR